MENDNLHSSETRTVIYLLQITGFILLLSLRNNDFSFEVHNDKLIVFQFFGGVFRKANSVWNSHWNILLLVSVTWQSLFFALRTRVANHSSWKFIFVFLRGVNDWHCQIETPDFEHSPTKENLMKGTAAHPDEKYFSEWRSVTELKFGTSEGHLEWYHKMPRMTPYRKRSSRLRHKASLFASQTSINEERIVEDYDMKPQMNVVFLPEKW